MAQFLFLSVLSLLYTLSYGQQPGTVVLSQSGVRNSIFTSGLVEVYDSTWQFVCYDGITQTEADVICHQLGYTGANSFSQSNEIAVTRYNDVSCADSQYLTLYQCDYNPLGSCSSSTLEVECSSERLSDDPYNGQIRLVNGGYSSEGDVEVYCNDQWGAVCTVDALAADIICNQLGYTGAAMVDSQSISDDTSISYEEVSCDFEYSCLSSCNPSCASSGTSCTERVFVACEYESSRRSVTTTETCDFTDLEEALSNLVGIIVGVVIAGIVVCALCVTIPICICCCLGVGIGAAIRKA